MGAILTPTAEMQGYTVEVRRESFYLSARQESLVVLRAEHADTGAVARWQVPVVKVPALVAAFDQVMSHQAFFAGAHRDEAAYEAVADGDHVVVDGPGHFYSQEWPAWEDQPAVVYTGGEIEYRHLRQLRASLAEVVRLP